MASSVTVDVTRVNVTPNQCALTEPLTVEIDYRVDGPVPSAYWAFSYVVDFAGDRHVLDLGRTEARDLPAGAHTLSFRIPNLDVSSIPRRALLNVGLLNASLRVSAGDEDVMVVKMVTQVSAKPGTKDLVREIFNPLE